MTTGRHADAASAVARSAIRNVLALHSRGIDRACDALLAGAYHADAAVDYGFFKGPSADFIRIICAAQRGGRLTAHRSGSPWIQLRGDHAVSETYIIAQAQTPVEGDAVTQRLIGGRYLDRHARRHGEWRISHRHYVLDWNINRSAISAPSAGSGSPGDIVPRGGHGDADAGSVLLARGHHRMQQAQREKQMTATDSMDLELRAALDREAIHNLLMAYARGVDRADQDLLQRTLCADATIITGLFNGSGHDFAQFMTRFVPENLQRCFHSIANEWVDVRGDCAVGEAYVIAYSSAGGSDVLTGGRYLCEFERREAGWCISGLTFIQDWQNQLPGTFATDGMYEALDSRGCYGRDDPVYGLWERG